MTGVLKPLDLLLVALAGWINQRQLLVIEYLTQENRVLKQQLGNKRLRLTDEQRRLLAVKGQALGRRALSEVASIVTPDTIMRWFRRLIAAKWDYSKRRGPGRPPVMLVLRKLIVQMGLENPRWGYDRIEGELRKLGHRVSPTTVRNILQTNGLEPAPKRRKGMTWRQFLSANWSCLAAADFFTVEVMSLRGLVTYYVFFVMDLSTRHVHVAGLTRHPDSHWMMQIAKNLTDPVEGFLTEKRYLILDRDTKYSDAFRHILKTSGVTPLRLPYRSPNLNACAERFIRSIKQECLGQLIFFSERTLGYAITQYVEHYHLERPHQGVNNRPLVAVAAESPPAESAECRKRLGGLLRSYHRTAA